MKYIEIAQGGVKHRGVIIPEDELSEKVEENRLLKDELYYTVWTFDDALAEHFKLYKTIRSFRGKASLNYVIFDIDKGTDTDEFVLRRTQEFVRRLQQDWDVRPEELRIYYSGSGYHLYMPNYFKFEESEAIRQEVKNTLKEHFPEVDLSIYGATGLIRAPYSLNRKTNRYKIPLDAKELFSLTAEEIIKFAESSELRDVENMEDGERDFSNYIVKAIVEREALHYRDEPTKIVTCMQHLFNKGGTNGTRHIEAMRLTSAWRRQGVPKGAIQNLIIEWAPSMEKYEIERIVNNVFDAGYKYGCNDHVMSKYCDAKCIYYINKNYTLNITMPDELESKLIENAVNMPFKKFIDLETVLGLDNPFRIYEGELVVLAGDTKIGKSTLAQNIVCNTPHIKWLVLPLENGELLDGRRYLQIAYGWTKAETYENLTKFGKGLIQKINHVKFSESSITLADLQKLIMDSEADAILIDTVDQIRVVDKNGRETEEYTAKTNALALGLTDIKRTTGKTIIVVHHTSKHGTEDSDGRRKKLTIHGLKGASAIEQKANTVIAIEGERDEEERLISSLGARDESPFKKLVRFNKSTFRLEV